MRATLVLLWAAVFSAAAGPQQAPDQQIIRMDVNLVQVDAVVTDAKGRPVTDLRAEDFEVRQDGRPQQITALSYVKGPEPADAVRAAAPGAPSSKVGTPRPEDVRRTIGLVVDDLSLSFADVSYVRDALFEFVDREMRPGDLVAVIRTSKGSGILQQFTTDKQALRAAVRDIKFSFRNRVGPDALPQIVDQRNALESAMGGTLIDKDHPEKGRVQTGSGNMGVTPVGDGRQSLEFQMDPSGMMRQQQGSFERDFFSAGTLSSLNWVVRGLKAMPGRKSVIVFSENMTIQQKDSMGQGMLQRLQLLTDLANRSGVVLYTVDPRGTPYLGFRGDDEVFDTPTLDAPERLLKMRDNRREYYFESRSGLGYMAEQTGGLYLSGVNDVPGLMRKALADQSGYYLIGYRPEDGTFEAPGKAGKYHEIKVKALRAGLKTRSRNGFFNVTDAAFVTAPPMTQGQRMARALSSPMQAGEIGVQLTPLFDVDAKQGPSVFSLLHIDARNLTFRDEPGGWHSARVAVVTAAIGEDSTIAESSMSTFQFRAKGEEYRRLLEHGVVCTKVHAVKRAGPAQLRVVVADENSDKLGSASEFMEVPNVKSGRLALSGILLMSASPEAVRNLTGRSAGGEDSGAPFEGHAAIRHFQRGTKVTYGYKVFNVSESGSEPQLMMSLRMFREGQEVLRTEPKPLDAAMTDSKSRVMVGGVLNLDRRFVPGEYALQFVVWDRLAKAEANAAAQSIDFQLE